MLIKYFENQNLTILSKMYKKFTSHSKLRSIVSSVMRCVVVCDNTPVVVCKLMEEEE